MQRKIPCCLAPVLFIGVLVTAGASVCLGENLLSNPGFEQAVGVATPDGPATWGSALWNFDVNQPYGNGAIVNQEAFYASYPPYDIHSGANALRLRKYYGPDAMEIKAYQDVYAVPESSYSASAWVRTRGAFGNSACDLAEVWVQELDGSGQPIAGREYKASTTTPTPSPGFQQLSLSFVAGASTVKVRFILHFVILETYNQGDATFDDCVLDGPPIPALLSGTVTSGGAPVEGATVTAGGKTTQTDAAGAYSLTGLITGQVTLQVSKAGYYAESKGVNLVAGENTADVEIFPTPVHNLLQNPGFETWSTVYSMSSASGSMAQWNYQFVNNGIVGTETSNYAYPERGQIVIHGGSEAVRTPCWGDGDIRLWQDIRVKPNTDYTASAWVWPYAVNANGFGAWPTDSAGIEIQSVDSDGNVIEDIGEVKLTTAQTGYRCLRLTFNTGDATKVRYALHTTIAADYSAGHVKYDDCGLDGPDAPVTVTGTVTDNFGTLLEGAIVSYGGKSDTTGPDGVYTITEVAGSSAPVSVQASKAGYDDVNSKPAPMIDDVNTVDFVLYPSPETNLLVNPGFELGALNNLYPYFPGASGFASGWNFSDVSGGSYFFSEADPNVKWGLRWSLSGSQALRIFVEPGGGVSRTSQKVGVLPGSQYTASTFARTDGPAFVEFGSDVAALVVEELGADGAVITTHRAEQNAPGDYIPLSLSFEAGAETVWLDYVLETTLAHYYSEAWVVYDNCALSGAGVPRTLSGTVASGGTPIGGASVSLQAMLPTGSKLLGTTTTAVDGTYAFSGLPDDAFVHRVIVRASASGYFPVRVVRSLVLGPNTIDLDLTPVGDNLIRNAGFEDGLAPSWTNQGAGPESSFAVYANIPVSFYQGAEAAFVGSLYGNSDGWIYQEVPVQPGGQYTASVKLRCHTSLPREGHPSRWGDTGDNQVAYLYVQQRNAAGQAIGSELRQVAVETGDWEALSLTFTADPQTAYVTVGGYAFLISGYADDVADRALFDNFELVGPAGSGPSLGAIKGQADGSDALAIGKVVTAAFSGYYYIEEADRSSGIKVVGAAAVGSTVDVIGKVQTVDGERTLTNATILRGSADGAVPGPVGLNNRNTNLGLSAVGLYVTVWGRVDTTDAESGAFTINDGSGTSLKVYGSATAGDYVRVEGALGAELSESAVVPVLRAVLVEPALE